MTEQKPAASSASLPGAAGLPLDEALVDGRVSMFVTHLNWQPDHSEIRVAQMRFILALAPPGSVIMGDLNAKRGKIQGMEQIGGGKQRVRALVPQAEVARYVIDLRSMTGGRGAFSMSLSHYEELPQHLAQKVIDGYQKSREEAKKK